MAEQQNGHHQNPPIVVIMVPFPGQSHLNQALQISCLISSYNIQVHYIGSTIHNRQVRLRMQGLRSEDIGQLQFHDIPLPTFPSPPPNSDYNFPVHLQPSFEAYLHLREPVAALLRALSPAAKRVVVIHDSIIGSVVQDAATIPNAEIYTFNSISAFSLFFTLWELTGKPLQVEVPKGLPSVEEDCVSSAVQDFMNYQYKFLNNRSGDLYNVCRLMDGSYLDLLTKLEVNGNKKQWAIGPLNMFDICNHHNSNRQNKCLEWLAKQEPNSVLYISFGTTTTLSEEQINELAVGLDESETKFIWVFRDADKGNVFAGDDRRAGLPEGFEERIEGKGVIVRDWAPQLDILRHPSTGAFMCHCGWNSVLESISMGVPIAAWPIHSDQPKNAVLIAELLKVGLIIREWESRDKIMPSSCIKNAVRRLMASEEGDEIRKRAEEWTSTLRNSTGKGGVSRAELDSFVAHITRQTDMLHN